MANELQNAPVPPPAGPTVKKSHVGLIVGGVVVLGVLWMMGVGGGHGGGGAGRGTTASGTATSTAASSGTVAAAPASTESDVLAAAPAAASGNPLFGSWSLVDPADAAYCPTTEEFTADTSKWTQNGRSMQMKPIYDIQEPGRRVTVGYGDSYIGNWTVNGPDDLTLGQVGPPPYGIASFCKYHRM